MAQKYEDYNASIDPDEVDGPKRGFLGGLKKKMRNPSGNSLVSQNSRISTSLPDQLKEDALKLVIDTLRNSSPKELPSELENISIDQRAADSGNTLLHLAASCGDSDLVLAMLKRRPNYFIRNHKGLLPIHCAINAGFENILKIFLDFDSDLANYHVKKNDQERGLSLLHWAIWEKAFSCVRFLVNRDPGKVNELCWYGTIKEASVFHLAYALINFEDKEENKKGKIIQEHKDPHEQLKSDVDKIVSLFLQHCTSDILITKESGSVMPKFLRFQSKDAITFVYNKFRNDKAFLKKFSCYPNNKGVTPVQEAIRSSSEPSRVSSIVDLLLKHGAEIKDALEVILEVSSLDLLRVVLNNRGDMTTSDVINFQDPTTKQTFLHAILESENSREEIMAAIVFLLDNDVDLLVKSLRKGDATKNGESSRQSSSATLQETEILLPIHLAMHVQIAENKNKQKNDRGNVYFEGLRSFGFPRIFQALPNDSKYIQEFFQEHLIPAAYLADHEAVHELLELLFSHYFVNYDNHTDKDIKYDIIHFKRDECATKEISRVYTNSLVFWATENANKQMMMDIVRAEHTVHHQKGEPDEGLGCIRKSPRYANLKYKAAEAYYERLGKGPNWCAAVLSTFFEVFFFCYFLYGLDLFFDLDLMFAYRNESLTYGSRDNVSVNWTSRTYHTLVEELGRADTFQTAYLISVILIFISLSSLVIIIYQSSTLPALPIPTKYRIKCLYNAVKVFKPIIFLVSHPIRACRSKAYKNNVICRNNYKEGWMIWVKIRRVELAIESTVQLLLQLWLSGPFMKELSKLENAKLFYHLWIGLGYLISLTSIDATFVEIMMAKYLMSALILCFGFTIIRLQKKSQRMADSKEVFLSYFISCVLQMFMRTMDFSLLFRLPLEILIVLLPIHFLVSGILKVVFEMTWFSDSESPFGKLIDRMGMIFQLVICTIGSTFVYLNIDNSAFASKKPDVKNSFIPVTLHFVLIFVEHIVLISIAENYSDDFSSEYGDLHLTHFKWVPLALWVCACLSMALYYKFFNKANLLRKVGPSFNKVDSQVDCTGVVCFKIRQFHLKSPTWCEKFGSMVVSNKDDVTEEAEEMRTLNVNGHSMKFNDDESPLTEVTSLSTERSN